MPLTILKGLKESGITMHQMEKDLDTGKILIQRKCPVYPDKDNLTTLSNRQCQLIPEMVKELVSNFDKLWDNARPQEGKAEYWEMPTKEDYTVYSDMSFDDADLILRAFKGYECIYMERQQQEQFEIIDGVACKSENNDYVPQNALKLKDGYIVCERIRRI